MPVDVSIDISVKGPGGMATRIAKYLINIIQRCNNYRFSKSRICAKNNAYWNVVERTFRYRKNQNVVGIDGKYFEIKEFRSR